MSFGPGEELTHPPAAIATAMKARIAICFVDTLLLHLCICTHPFIGPIVVSRLRGHPAVLVWHFEVPWQTGPFFGQRVSGSRDVSLCALARQFEALLA